jgi:hypothetical protein
MTKRAERQRVLEHAFRFLDEAEGAVGRADIVGEELLIQRGERLVARLGGAAKDFAAEVLRRTEEGRLRRGEAIGVVGHIFIWTDRVLLRG